MKYAIISDIHGNNIALQNVIADAKQHQVDAYIFVGDYCVCAPWPKGVTETLQNIKNAFVVKGNEESYFNIPESDDGQFEISRWSRKQLLPEQIEWLNQLTEQLEIEDGDYKIFIAHKSESFIGTVEFDNFGPSLLAEQNRSIAHNEMLDKVNNILEQNKEFLDKQKQIPKGIYIFGHSHIQWHKEIDGHLYINPGSCGLPLDCETYFGAPYTLLTVDKGGVSVEERRIKYDVYDLINQVKETSQYKEAYVWSEVTFQEWIHSRDHIDFFLKYVEEYANKIGDDRRPFAKETWREAFTAWEAHREMNDVHIQRGREEWLDIADSDWYMSCRKEDVIREIL